MLKKFHPFHIVEKRPWPLFASISALFIVRSVIFWVNTKTITALVFSLFLILFVSFLWWRDVFSETSRQGNHRIQVTVGLQLGILLFILSEVLFFFSFFWAFFHRSISPSIELGQAWPPNIIIPFNPMNIPLLNTLLLISSGVSVTWCHHSILNKNKQISVASLYITISLGVLFSILQWFEYIEAPFSLADSVFGSTFFIATGFHGLHVLIGSTFLLVSIQRLISTKNSPEHITGFECAAWYWHFVDVVWLFLYLNIYWWGS